MNTTPPYSVIAVLFVAAVGMLAGCASSQTAAVSPATPEVVGTMEFKNATIPVYRNVQADMSVAPVYPAGVQKDGIGGAGLVRIVVDQTGEALSYLVVGSTPTPDFGRAVLGAARQWKYFPMNGADGRPIVYALEVSVNFGISDVKWPTPGPVEYLRPSSYESFPK